ncbi:uncharacterized, partial [Tachysurus ichikawai]
AALNLGLTLSQQAPSSTNSHQNSNTREIRSHTPTGRRDNTSGLEMKGRGRQRERGGRRGRRRDEGVREKGRRYNRRGKLLKSREI